MRPTQPPFINQVPTTIRSRPRVKSNLLLNRQKNKKKNNRKKNQRRFKKVKGRQRERNRSRLPFNNNVASNDIGSNVINEDDPCSNPFKCPPSKRVGGGRPRVKSNIK